MGMIANRLQPSGATTTAIGTVPVASSRPAEEGSNRRTRQGRRPRWSRAPDFVIGIRVMLAFVVVGLYSLSFPFAAAALVLTMVVIAMDALDGILARRLGVTSDFGAVIDIMADRIVEHVFWIYFAVVGGVPLWVPIVIVTRSFVVDTVRSLALARGRTAFGDKSMMRSPVSRFFVASRFMRGVYGFTKVAAFVLLGTVIVIEKAADGAVFVTPTDVLRFVEVSASGMTVVAVALNLIRGLPVVWDSRTYLCAEGSGSDQ